MLDYDYYFRVVDALLLEDAGQILLLLDEILKMGFDGDIFMNGLAEHLRNILVAKDNQTVQLLNVSDSLKSRYLAQANLSSPSFIISALDIANECDVNYKMARNKRLHVEMAMIKMAYINRVLEASSLPVSNGQLEKKTSDLRTEAPEAVVPSPPLNTLAESNSITEEVIKEEAPSKQDNPIEKEAVEVFPEPEVSNAIPENDILVHSQLKKLE